MENSKVPVVLGAIVYFTYECTEYDWKSLTLIPSAIMYGVCDGTGYNRHWYQLAL